MSLGILGKKVGMSEYFDAEGKSIAVTIIEAGPCPIVQKKTEETKDKYNAIQIGFQDKKRQRVNKPQLGHFDKANVPAKQYLREIRLTAEEVKGFEVGQEVNAGIFQNGEYVDVTGQTKGKGFTGVMKHYHFHGASEMTHGAHEYKRHGGSIGSSAEPSRVFKNKRMPGRVGNERVTIQNLKVIEVRPEQNLLLVQGGIPGPINGMVIVRKARKKQKKQE
jgi:large subunit ribosomal protein L3